MRTDKPLDPCPHTDFTIATETFNGMDSAAASCICGLRGKTFTYERGYTLGQVQAEENALLWWEANVIDRAPVEVKGDQVADFLGNGKWEIEVRNGHIWQILTAGQAALSRPEAPALPARPYDEIWVNELDGVPDGRYHFPTKELADDFNRRNNTTLIKPVKFIRAAPTVSEGEGRP